MVDAKPTTPLDEGTISTSYEPGDAGAGRTESPPSVLEKVWGNRVATDELAQKKRRTADVAPCKSGGISIDGSQTARTQSAAMSEWSGNDGTPVAPPPSTEAPPRNTCVKV